MSFCMVILGIMAAVAIDTENPAHVNYSLVALTAICFSCAAYIEVKK